MKKLYFLVILFVLQGSSLEAKVHVSSLGGINWFEPGSSEEFLNPLHGVVFNESGLLENIGTLKHDDDNEEIMQARKLINALFHRLPSGFFPSDVPSKISYYLEPKLIGRIIGIYHSSSGGLTRKQREDLLALWKHNLFFGVSFVRNKLRFQQKLYCAASSELKLRSPFNYAFSTKDEVQKGLCNGGNPTKTDFSFNQLNSHLKQGIRNLFTTLLPVSKKKPFNFKSLSCAVMAQS